MECRAYPPAFNSNQQTTTAHELPNNMASTINVPSVCIPRVHSSMDGDGVAQVFNEVFGQDCVHHVDMVQREDRKTGYPFFIAYVHFDVIRDVEASNSVEGTSSWTRSRQTRRSAWSTGTRGSGRFAATPRPSTFAADRAFSATKTPRSSWRTRSSSLRSAANINDQQQKR